MQMKCPKCGATLEVDPKKKMIKCDYCSSLLYVDKSGLMFYYVIPFKIDKNTALGIYRRWASSSMVAKDLLAKGRIVKMEKFYFPVYLFKREVDGREKYIVEPARGTTLPGMRRLEIPPGSFILFDSNFRPDARVMEPEISITYYLPQLEGKPLEQYLVFFPVWEIDYIYEGRKYNLVIDGSTGEIYVSEHPMRKSYPYLGVAIGGFVSSFLISLGFFGVYGDVPPSVLGLGLLLSFAATFIAGYIMGSRGW